MKALRQPWADHRTCDNCEECCEFEDAVAPGEQLGRQKFGKQPVFRGAEEGGLRTSQENYDKCHAGITPREGVHGKKHRANFENLCSDRDAPLAETVG